MYQTVLFFIVYALVGKLFMFFLRKFPPARRVAEYLHFDIDCNLCLGFWVYLFLDFVWWVNVVNFVYIPFVSEVITAAFTSWTMHLLTIGWNSEYRIYEVK